MASIGALQSRPDQKIQSVLQKQEQQDKSNIYLNLGYRQIGLKYYYFNHYMTFDWINAVGFCRLMKGDLVTFESAIELSNVQHGMYFSYSNMWICLHDICSEGTFHSIKTGSIAPFLTWAYGAPNNAGGAENCVELTNYPFYAMNDAPCTQFKGCICEAEI